MILKVAAYITAADRLLVFSEPAFPEAGMQIPGGTVEPGEDPDSAVLREAAEETGLAGLQIQRFLGARIYKFTAENGEDVAIHRRFYHLTYDGPITADGWRHWEKDPSDGTSVVIEFHLQWVRMPHQVPALASGFGDLLPTLENFTD